MQTDSSPPTKRESRRGARLAGYVLLGTLAQGGMGTVLLAAKDGDRSQALYAIKLLHRHLSRDAELAQMLQNEARAAAMVTHPNVVRIHEIGFHESRYFLVMEYVEGCALSDLLNAHRDARPAALLASILGDTLQGLHAVHTVTDASGRSLELVHRDVTPKNILVGIDGAAKLADFGISKSRSHVGMTRPGMLKGTPAYVAPEQALGEGRADARSDVFSAGAVLWTALTGRRLFGGKTPRETLHAVLNKPVSAPSEVGLRPPKAFDEVCLRALERDPRRRYQSAAEMGAALAHAARQTMRAATRADTANWVVDTFGHVLMARQNVVAQQRLAGAAPSDLPPLRDAPSSDEQPTMDAIHQAKTDKP